VVEAPLPISPCGGTTVGTGFLIYSGGSVSAGTTCTFDVMVRVPAAATAGTYTNTTGTLSATIDGAARVLPPATDLLVVENNLIGLTKTFLSNPVAPGGTVDVEFTLTNLDPVNALSNVAFSVDFDGLLTGLTATGLPQSGVCGAGATLSGTGVISLVGGNLAGGASCTFTVTLQIPTTVPLGSTLTCTTSSLTGRINGLIVLGDPASDDLEFQQVILTKAFTGSIEPGGTTSLTFSLTNHDPLNPANDISFFDNLGSILPGMVATDLPMNDICGMGSTLTGTSNIVFDGGILAAGASCMFTVTVQVPCDASAGMYTNVTSPLSLGGIEGASASADFTVTSLGSASFTALNEFCAGAVRQEVFILAPVLRMMAMV